MTVWSVLYVRDTLQDIGLPSEPIGIIMKCMQSGSYNLLQNGEETKSVMLS